MDLFRTGLKGVVEQWNKLRLEKNVNHELEFRVGRFSSQNSFVPGLQVDEKIVITRLIQCLDQEVLSSPSRWSKPPDFYAVRSYHAQNIRQTHIRQINKTTKTIYERKNNITHVDIRTDRPLHIRASLSKEESLQYQQDSPEFIAIRQQVTVANSVCLLTRISFIEKLEHAQYGIIRFRYDITRLSPQTADKKECCAVPCQYHIELEIVEVSSPLTDPDHIQYLVEHIIIRLQFILGTHQVSSTQPDSTPPTILTPATLRIIN